MPPDLLLVVVVLQLFKLPLVLLPMLVLAVVADGVGGVT